MLPQPPWSGLGVAVCTPPGVPPPHGCLREMLSPQRFEAPVQTAWGTSQAAHRAVILDLPPEAVCCLPCFF